MTTDDLFDALERCAATSSKKGKLEIVKTLGQFSEWLRRAQDPAVAYYVTKLPKCTHSGDSTLGPEDFLLLDRLASREYSGNEALQRIDDTMRDLTPKSQQLLRRTLLKDLRCGVGESILNAAFPGLIPVFPYQRCVLEKDSNMGKWVWEAGILVQLKADGSFANVNVDGGRLGVHTRQGTPYPPGALGDLETALKTLRDGTQTHGELLVYDGDGMMLQRADGNGILNSILQGGQLPEKHSVTFYAWDQIPLGAAVDKGRYEVPYETRLAQLQSQMTAAAGEHLTVIPTHCVRSRAEAMKLYKRYLDEGLEGIIAKHPKATWRDGDNKDQVKFKLEVDVDLEVEEILPGDEGKRTEGRPGRLRMRTSCGKLRVNVTVKNEKMRDALEARPDLFLGKILPVRANAVESPKGSNDNLHSLYLPRFVEDTPRVDKPTADDLQRVIDQFEAAVAA